MNLTISSCGSLNAYISAVNNIPALTAERERELGLQLKADDNLAAAHELILAHLRLVVSITRRYVGYGLPQEDLIQEGTIGLMKAVKKFDISREVRLASLAVHWIKAEIHEFILKNWRIVKIATTKAKRKIFFNLRSLKAELEADGKVCVEDLAGVLAVAPAEILDMEVRMLEHVSLEGPTIPAGEEIIHLAPIDYLADTSLDPLSQLEAKQLGELQKDNLLTELNKLSPRERLILEARFLQPEKSTLQELAAKLNISTERVRQVEAKALKKLRGSILSDLS